ncbi:MAG TPA: aspartate carbamoyltransferase regulatory subunit [Candidatus Mcinerneyibacterium sp.]|nr:aspartate carbamoyltransferase regulatory subunit [Candidatus Mcinerneyibacterium sp.]
MAKNNSERPYKVFKIEKGTVIDHIPAPKGLLVLEILGKENDGIVSIGLNFDSNKVGKKDLIKFENKIIDKEETDKIALVAPEATINIIENGEVTEKRSIDVPQRIHGFLKCMNPNCIVNVENLESKFKVIDENPVKLRCDYCERVWEVKYDMIEKNRKSEI